MWDGVSERIDSKLQQHTIFSIATVSHTVVSFQYDVDIFSI